MPWISVHDSINGSKLRKLFKTLDCSKFEAAGILMFLWFWGLNNADKTGNMPLVDSEDIVRELYGVGTGCHLDMEKVVQALFDTGWIDKNDDGSLRLHDWDVWQEQWYKAVERREKDAARKARERNEKKGGDCGESSDTGLVEAGLGPPIELSAKRQDDAPRDPPIVPMMDPTMATPNAQPIDASNDPKETGTGSPPDKKREKKSYKPAFEDFWEAYPRKTGKGEAYIKYNARLKDGWSETDLLRAAKNYAYVVKKKHTEEQYIKHAKTFLSENTPFIDFIPKRKVTTEQAPSGANPFAEYKDE